MLLLSQLASMLGNSCCMKRAATDTNGDAEILEYPRLASSAWNMRICTEANRSCSCFLVHSEITICANSWTQFWMSTRIFSWLWLKAVLFNAISWLVSSNCQYLRHIPRGPARIGSTHPLCSLYFGNSSAMPGLFFQCRERNFALLDSTARAPIPMRYGRTTCRQPASYLPS